MTACRRMRNVIIAVVRGQASEADRLRLEQHLAVCASCRVEKAQWLLMENLQEEEPQRLSTDARVRILRHLTNLPKMEVVEVEKARRLVPMLWGATAAVAVAIALLIVLPNQPDPALGRADKTNDHRPQQGSVTTDRAIAIRAQSAGTIDAGGAHIIYGERAEFRIQPGGRQVELYAGEIDIEVAPGGRGRFRVLAPRFTVEVLGTRFVVGLDRVVTLHGLVRVVEPDAAGAKQLALVSAGQTWRLPVVHELAELNPSDPHGSPLGPTPTALPTPDLPSANSPLPSHNDQLHPVGTDTSTDSSPMAEPQTIAVHASRHGADNAQSGIRAGAGSIHATSPSVERLLTDAREALAGGNTRRARECVTGALKAKPKARQRAIAELLSADTLLVESRYTAALAAYRRTMDMFGKYPEGETAAFALAQLLSERGPQDQAREALERYLERYPAGRFAEDVAKKFANTPAP